MKTMNGIYVSAKFFTTNNETTSIDDYAIHQIQLLCDNPVTESSCIRIMPDVHLGKVGTIDLQ